MRPSSTSSSDAGRPVRASSRHRRAAAAAAAAFAALLASLPLLQASLVEAEFRVLDVGLATEAALEVASSRPLLAFVGSSQTRRSVDALAVEGRLAADESAPPCVFNLGVDGVHAGAAPFVVRHILRRARVDTVVLELGHISHDQYRGIEPLRDLFADAEVRDALGGTPRGARIRDLRARERLLPWNGVARTLRVIVDAQARVERSEFDRATMHRSRGWRPTDHRKSREELLAVSAAIDAAERHEVLDASPQEAFLAAARICADECARRGARLAVLLQPVNREIARETRVLRHFEATARARTLPALRDAGIPVLDPPDRFWEAERFCDHVHLHRDAASEFSAWVASALASLR